MGKKAIQVKKKNPQKWPVNREKKKEKGQLRRVARSPRKERRRLKNETTGANKRTNRKSQNFSLKIRGSENRKDKKRNEPLRPEKKTKKKNMETVGTYREGFSFLRMGKTKGIKSFNHPDGEQRSEKNPPDRVRQKTEHGGKNRRTRGRGGV